MPNNQYDEDDNWLEVYNHPGELFERYCGDHEHLQPFKNFKYYQCWGGGPEGGYITDKNNQVYEVNRSWGQPFTLEAIQGRIVFQPSNWMEGIPSRIRISNT